MEICVKKETVPVYPQDFYPSHDGNPIEISDKKINEWIERIMKDLELSEKEEDFEYVSCGDAFVLVLKSTIGYKFIVTKEYSDMDIIFEN